MRAFGLLQQRSWHLALAGTCALVFAGLTDAAAQFPPPPGQSQNQSQSAPANSPFPPPPQGQQQNQLQSPFPPAPGTQPSTPAFGGAPPPSAGGFGAMQQGGFGVRPGGFSGGPAQGSFSGPAQGGFAGPPAGPTEEQKVCLTFPSIRDEVEKGAAGIRAAGERKAAREEVCPLFKSFAVKEAKLVKFLETNQRVCGVPPNVITQVRQNHAKTIQIRNTVCSAAPAAAAGPSLSDALGGPIIADDTSTRSGRGVFDTLTGNALQR